MMRVLPPLVGLLVTVSFTACTSSSQVSRFATAGTAYTTAMDSLLLTSEQRSIDAESEEMLSLTRNLQDESARKAVYDRFKGQKDLVSQIERLRTHGNLLSQYFTALNALATTDAPARAQASAEGAANAVSKLGETLTKSPLLTSDQVDLIGQLSNLAVTAYRNQLLSDEIKARANLIRKEIVIHKLISKAITAKIQTDTHTIIADQTTREIEVPFTKGTLYNNQNASSDWVTNRRAIILQDAQIAELDAANDAADKLEKAWIALVEGKMGDLAIKDFLAEAEKLVAIAETFKKVTN